MAHPSRLDLTPEFLPPVRRNKDDSLTQLYAALFASCIPRYVPEPGFLTVRDPPPRPIRLRPVRGPS